MSQATLLFLLEGESILLAMKKRGFGAGRWNGVGGKLNPNETVNEAAIRECQEEIGVTPKELREVATLNFVYSRKKKDYNQQVLVFTSKSWDGKPTESEEMAPKWFHINKIPYQEMWADDKYWLPKVIARDYVHGEFYFDDEDKLLRHKLVVS